MQASLEAGLVQKKLEADIAKLQDDDQCSTRGPEMEDWLRHADHSQREPTYDSLLARGTRPFHDAPPAVNTCTHFTERRPERRSPNRYEDTRVHSPTPTRSRNRSIEALVESFERMSRYRPPPRSSTELPTFNGSENEWMPFKASMRDSTRLHKFSPIENMQRLRNALKGEARNAVASLLYTACDPAEIMEALEQSFGRPEALIDKALEEIKLLPRLGSTTTELNVFAVKVRNIVATITNVEGLDGCLQNRMLTRDIVDKLPPDLRRSFAKYASENRRPREPHVVILSRFLNNEATIGLEFTYSKPTAPVTSSWKESHPRSTRTVYKTPWEIRNIFTAKSREQCMCCGGDHEPPQCMKIKEMSINARWNWAKVNKICFKCLRKRHQRTECKADQCGVDDCIHSHHPLLHEPRSRSEGSNTNSDASLHQVEVVDSATTYTKSRSNVMLKVCPIIVKNSNGVEIRTFALLDEGSTITLIEEDLANQLNLAGSAHALNIRGVNCTQTEETSRIVRLKLRGKSSKILHTIQAKTIKRFHLMHQTIPQELLRCEHLQNLNPSEVCYQQARPRMLIGSDNWQLIVSKQLLTGGRNEPAASRTELGWVIHGTAPRGVMTNEDDEHVFHLRAGNCTQSSRHELKALDHSLETDPIGVSDETTFHTTMHEKDRKEHEMKETVQLQLPRYYNTRGVRTFQRPFRNISGQTCFYTAKVHLRKKTTAEQREVPHHLELAEKLWKRTAEDKRFARDLKRIHAGQVIKRSYNLAKPDPFVKHDLLQVCGRLDAIFMSNPAKLPITSIGRHLSTRLQLTHERAVRPLNSERTVNVSHQKCCVITQRTKRKKVALKCFASCARRPKRAAAGWLYSNPREVLDCRSDPRDPVACNGHYVMADERCIPTSTQRQLQKNTLEEIDIRSITRTLGGVFQRTIKKLAVLTKN